MRILQDLLGARKGLDLVIGQVPLAHLLNLKILTYSLGLRHLRAQEPVPEQGLAQVGVPQVAVVWVRQQERMFEQLAQMEQQSAQVEA